MTPPTDFDVREVARTTFDTTVVVEAGAGTGKTAVLVTRTITWILDGGWSVHADGDRGAEEVAVQVLKRVLALTFTEKAAGEMARRVGEALKDIIDGKRVLGMPDDPFPGIEPDDLKARAKACLVHQDRLLVTTIHAWCRRLLAAHPVQAGMHPKFEVDAEGLIRRDVVDDVIGEWVGQAFGDDGDEDAQLLATDGYGPEAIWDALETLAESGVTASDIDPDPFAEARFPAAREDLSQALHPLIEATRPFVEAGSGLKIAYHSATWLVVLGDELETSSGFESVHSILESDEASAAINRIATWSKGTFNKGETAALLMDETAVAEAAAVFMANINVWNAFEFDLMPRAARVLRTLLEDMRRRLDEHGVVSFSDLIAQAARLLEQDRVCDRVREELDLLLVDEFQDTDRRQYDIVGRIALEGHPRPSLFLVGDPKQSIYGWRQADLAAYDRFLARVRETDGVEPLVLSVNFRSVPPILQEVERIMLPTMRKCEGLQPEFQPLQASEKRAAEAVFDKGDRRPVEQWVSWSRGADKSFSATPAERARDIEAEAIARDIKQLHDDQKVKWSSFGILFRARSALEKYLRPLRDAGIPFQVEGDREFYRRREVVDVVNLVRVIIDPNDHLALVGFIRSPMVGVPDAALVPLWQQALPAHMSELDREPEAMTQVRDAIAAAARTVPDDAAGVEQVAGWEHALTEAARAVASLRRSLAEDAADLFVERLRGLLLSETLEGARYLGAHRVANLDQVFRKIFEALTRAGAGPETVLRELKGRVEDIRPEKTAAVGDDDVDAVRIMTVHMSKGLDFGHLYLPDLHRVGRDGGSDGTRVVVTDEGQEASLMGMPSARWGRVKAHERDIRTAESVRLLYVALTRARDRLVMLGRWSHPDKLGDGVPKSMIDLVARRPGTWDPLLRRWITDPEAPPFEDDEHGVRWRLLPDTRGLEHADVERPDHELDVQGIAARSAQWIAAAPAAAARAAIPRVKAASSASHEAFLDTARDRSEDDRDPVPASLEPSETRRFAREIGTAVHGVLEELDLDGDQDQECVRALQRIPLELANLVPPDELEQATEMARTLVAKLADSQLMGKLFALSDHVVGREVPLLHNEKGDGPTVVGAIDLLYRDPGSGEYVIADYKTDRVPDDEGLQSRARTYRAQGEAYIRAVQDALGLENPPRFELWFLHHDEVVDA